MTQSLINLLAIDGAARQHGCGLNPALRAAIETDLRFPARAASPLPTLQVMADLDPEVAHLDDHRPQTSKRTRA